MEAWSFGFLWGFVWKTCQHPICGGLVGSGKMSIVGSPSPGQVHWDLYIIVAGSWCHSQVIGWLSPGLLWVILVRWTLRPVAGLEVVSWLVKFVLGATVWDSPPGPYGFNHLSGFSVLDHFSFVLVVVSWEWGADDCI
jgi:hypothetical protein